MIPDNQINIDELSKVRSERERAKIVINRINALVQNSSKSTTVAIKGEWGSGKSSYLKMLESYYKDYCEFPTLFFEAWRYKNDSNYLYTLINEISNLDITAKAKIKEFLKPIAREFLYVGLNFADLLLKKLDYSIEDITNTMDKVDELTSEYKSNYKESIKALEEAINIIKKQKTLKKFINKDYKAIWQVEIKPPTIDKRLFVIVIDDLDRLTPNDAFKIIETLRFYFDIDGLLIIMGINDSVIQKYVQEVFKETNREKFTEKIFNYTISLKSSMLNRIHLRKIDLAKQKQYLLYAKELNINLPHRKWIKVINRCEGYSRLTKESFAHALILELFYEFELIYRNYPNIELSSILNPLTNIGKILNQKLHQDNSFVNYPTHTIEKIKKFIENKDI